MLGEIEIFLNERMGRDARPARDALFVQAVVPSHDVEWKTVAGNISVGDGVRFSIQNFSFRLFWLITKQRHQRQDEKIARLRNSRLSFSKICDLRLIASPKRF